MSRRRISRKFADPSREHIILVGAPSNTFNGYFHENDDASITPETPPANTSGPEIEKYIKGHPALRAKCQPPDFLYCTKTHDLYWANFIYSAVKLIETRRAQPEEGDILTLIVWLPGYEERQRIDWDASPYNPRHRNSPWVAGKKPYDVTVQAPHQGATQPPQAPTLPRKATTPPQPLTYASGEEDINHEILMRTTAESGSVDPLTGLPLPDGGFRKRPKWPNSYLTEAEGSLVHVPLRLSQGMRAFGNYPPVVNVPPLGGVQVKLLFLRDVNALYAYLSSGTWSGPRLRHPIEDDWDNPDADPGPSLEDATWTDQALTWTSGKEPKDWEANPAVDRTRVRIKRFDYFGHSNLESFFLQYGLTNWKGREAEGEITIHFSDLEPHLKKELFTPDSFAHLWGCSLGGDMAPMLTKFVKKVRACPGLTDYNVILDPGLPDAMPSPAKDSSPFRDYP